MSCYGLLQTKFYAFSGKPKNSPDMSLLLCEHCKNSYLNQVFIMFIFVTKMYYQHKIPAGFVLYNFLPSVQRNNKESTLKLSWPISKISALATVMYIIIIKVLIYIRVWSPYISIINLFPVCSLELISLSEKIWTNQEVYYK